jgi:hypothetical protein
MDVVVITTAKPWARAAALVPVIIGFAVAPAAFGPRVRRHDGRYTGRRGRNDEATFLAPSACATILGGIVAATTFAAVAWRGAGLADERGQ